MGVPGAAAATAQRPGEEPPLTAASVSAARPRRAALIALLVATAVLYLWDLSASGYANEFYAAAAQAGSASWKAFFFGASDAAGSITVDKPPAALWPMGLSVRLFGLNAWAVLAPEALMGVAAVGVLYASVRRQFGHAAGLLAGTVLALTPVAALMFRYDNPDALLCLLMVCAVACVLRALEQARTRWLLLAGLCFGLGFLTKALQAWLILPPLALLYAVCAPARLRRRIGQLLLAGLVTVVSGGWWVAAVELWPAASRPYIGGSQHNSFLELTFGYNGLGRINGDETGSVGGGGGPGGGRWGESGLLRMFGADVGGQIAWLLPAALVLLPAALWLLRRSGRTDVPRAVFLAWGGALLMTLVVFSFMSGIFHQYYTVALAPYVAALTGAGAVLLWRRRAFALLALVTAGTAGWAYVLLGRTPHWLPWLRWTVLAAGVLAGCALLVAGRTGRARKGVDVSGTETSLPETSRRAPSGPTTLEPATSEPGQSAGGPSSAEPSRARRNPVAAVAAGLAVVSALAAPLAYTLNTVRTPHGGSIVTAGPQVRGGFGHFGGRMRPLGGEAPQGGGIPAGFRPGNGGARPGGAPGGMASLLGGGRVDARTAALLKRDADGYTWAAAAVGSQRAAGLQLATRLPVMPVGGFNGSDPSPTLAQFQQYVSAGRIHYFVAGTAGRAREADRGHSAQITAWVEAHFTKVTVGSTVLYDLTAPRSGA
ncbi:glycosyltransferase family 39 protein [Streptomyces gamaensis]|uniref:Glycosyltransferase family 39 protein n=1 Tax=Streptomyces gamaensis TaxID=1763542 RepID=A0ABW0YVX0_9ACTN